MQELLGTLVWVALGSAAGGVVRFFLSGFIGRRIGETFPWGTMAVNITGAFVIGLVAAAADGGMLFDTPAAWAFVVTGVLGSYTTVSSFSLQTLALARDGDLLRAGGNVALSVVLCLCAVAAGFAIGASTFGSGTP